MQEYRLESHLETLCREHTSYRNLYSTWTLNKLACANTLKSTLTRYPYFSMHDASHAEAVLSKMEMLLGARIQNLSPTDTWLLLHAAYAHDLGMVVQWTEIEQVWQQPDFQEFLTSLASHEDREVRDAARFIQSAQKDASGDLLWPLKAHRYVDLINAAYFRRLHASMSREYIRQPAPDFKLDLGHQGLIQPRIIKLLGDICAIHTAPLSEVLKLDYRTDGVNADYAHPRLIAMLLRLGDLLDIDNGRFNTASTLSFGPLPESSVPHREKHEATSHLLVTPEEIQFRSDCPNVSAYLETRNFVTWLEEEVNFLTVQWPKIAPGSLGGYAPRFDRKELLINGVQDVQELAGCRFAISQEKAFQIIEGSNIYEDRFVFVREILQNAMDASKLQLWRDLRAGVYHAWLPDPDLSALQPYDLTDEIYRSYPISIRLSTTRDGMTQIEVEDRGTGISIDGFKSMCHVGTSGANSSRIQNDLREMPNWLRPTAGFGVGLQSIFLLTDQFEIDTGTGTESFHATLQTHRTGGHLQIQRTSPRPRGTVIRAGFPMPKRFSYSTIGDTNAYVTCHMDPIESENHIGEARILEAIRNHCRVSMFPIEVTCAETSLNQLEAAGRLSICDPGVSGWPLRENRYRCRLNDAWTEIRIWDTQTASFGAFTLNAQQRFATTLFFKGVPIHKGVPMLGGNIAGNLDLYGLDTKKALAMDRSSLTDEGGEAAREILDDLVCVYKACVLEKLKAVQNPADPQALPRDFPVYAFWQACDRRERAEIPVEIIKRIPETAVILSRSGGSGLYTQGERPVKDLILSSADQYFIDIEPYRGFPGEKPSPQDRILAVINSANFSEDLEIIADPVLTDKICQVCWNRAIVLKTDKEHLDLTICRGTLSDTVEDCLLDSGNMRRDILLGLGNIIPYLPTSAYLFSDREERAKRYAVPATRDYPHLAVTQLPFGSVHPYGRFRCYIIAPFVREDAAQADNLSRDQFVTRVMTSAAFRKVVDYVLAHSPHQTISKDQVTSSYERLLRDYYDAVHQQPKK